MLWLMARSSVNREGFKIMKKGRNHDYKFMNMIRINKDMGLKMKTVSDFQKHCKGIKTILALAKTSFRMYLSFQF